MHLLASPAVTSNLQEPSAPLVLSLIATSRAIRIKETKDPGTDCCQTEATFDTFFLCFQAAYSDLKFNSGIHSCWLMSELLSRSYPLEQKVINQLIIRLVSICSICKFITGCQKETRGRFGSVWLHRKKGKPPISFQLLGSLSSSSSLCLNQKENQEKKKKNAHLNKEI